MLRKLTFSVLQERFKFSYRNNISRNPLYVHVIDTDWDLTAKVVNIWTFGIFPGNQFVLRLNIYLI